MDAATHKHPLCESAGFLERTAQGASSASAAAHRGPKTFAAGSAMLRASYSALAF